MARVRVELQEVLDAPATNYFTAEKPHLQFVSSGCTLLDCALGGGWPLGRIVNIVGDKSTSKTGLACEALINFIIKYPKGRAAYRDCESAFDEQYAAAMGLPIKKIDFGKEQPETVEDFAKDLSTFVAGQIKADAPGIYVLDSLDALSDDAEMDAEFGKASYGTAKAKAMSALFRKLKGEIERSKVLLMIISQVRDNIGVTFGERHKRSGGRALDFYSSQIAWLSHMGTIKRTLNKIERITGIEVRAKVKKNKVGLPLREADFTFMFGFGVDDLVASVNFLEEVGRRDGGVKAVSISDPGYAGMQQLAAQRVKEAWAEIETRFLPTRGKYT